MQLVLQLVERTGQNSRVADAGQWLGNVAVAMILPSVDAIAYLIANEPQDRTDPLAPFTNRMNRIVGFRRRQFIERTIDLIPNQAGNSPTGRIRLLESNAIRARHRAAPHAASVSSARRQQAGGDDAFRIPAASHSRPGSSRLTLS